MNKPRSIRSRRLRPALLLGLIAVLLAVLAPPMAALAHPLDVYLQATYITVAPTQIVVELDLSPGVLVAPQVLPQLDPNGDQQISDAEDQAYLNTILPNVVLQVDGQPLALTVTKIDMPSYLAIQAGYGTIRAFTLATLPAGMTSTHQIAYVNKYAPPGSTYQVNAFVDKGVSIVLGKQNRNSTQQSMSMDYTIGSATSAAATGAAAAASLDTPIAAAAARGQAGLHRQARPV